MEEIQYQNKKWSQTSSQNLHSWEEWLTYIADYTSEAQHILSRTAKQDAAIPVGHIMRKIAAMACQAMIQNGIQSRTSEAIEMKRRKRQ